MNNASGNSRSPRAGILAACQVLSDLRVVSFQSTDDVFGGGAKAADIISSFTVSTPTLRACFFVSQCRLHIRVACQCLRILYHTAAAHGLAQFDAEQVVCAQILFRCDSS